MTQQNLKRLIIAAFLNQFGFAPTPKNILIEEVVGPSYIKFKVNEIQYIYQKYGIEIKIEKVR